ncbi:MAG: Glucose 1-dehydrogenase [Anaerolineales bacterium]|nr:Glucose 1-dehydrogenase [Anaerolineales bacterium]
MQGLTDKNVLVTGGTSGIGQAIAVRFAAEGAHVAINYRTDIEDAGQTDEMVHEAIEECRNQIARHGVDHILVQADVTKQDQVERMVQDVIDRLGDLDILVNNAGIQISGSSHEIEVDDFDKVIAVNLRGAYIGARAAIQHFLAEEKPGVIINVSSVHQIIPKPRFVGYSVSKGGMQNLTRTLALEYAGRNIRVNAIGPGATITPINRAWVDDPEKKEDVEQHIPMGRPGTSEEMAATTAFLASDEAAYITGQTLYVDGGLTLYPDFREAWSSE